MRLRAALAVPASAQGSYSPYDESATDRARPLRPHARLRPEGFRVADRRRPGRAGARRRAGRRRLLRPRRRRRSAQPAAAGRHGRGRRSPTAIRRRRCPISSGRSSSARRSASFACDRGLAYDLLGQQAQAQADYRARALAEPTATRRGAGLRSAWRSAATAAKRSQTLAPLSAQGRSGRRARPRLRPRADRRFQCRAERDQCRDARQLGQRRALPSAAADASPPARRPRRSTSASSRTRADGLRLCRAAAGARHRADRAAPTGSPASTLCFATPRPSQAAAAAGCRAGPGRLRAAADARERAAHRRRVPAEDLAPACQRLRRRLRCRRDSSRLKVQEPRPVRGHHALCRAERRRGAPAGRAVPRPHPTREIFAEDLETVGIDAVAMDQFPSRQDCATAG